MRPRTRDDPDFRRQAQRETTGAAAATASADLKSASLAEAAELAGVDLAEPFEAGQDTPPMGDSAAPLKVDAEASLVLMDWFRFGWQALDAALGALGPDATPSAVQLWPEHFDAGCDVAASPGHRVNLGASPGDSFSTQPYLDVGPWDAECPGGSEYWNAPFGAVLTYDVLREADDPAATARAFLLRGVALMAASAPA